MPNLACRGIQYIVENKPFDHTLVKFVDGNFYVWNVARLWDLINECESILRNPEELNIDDPNVWFNSFATPTVRMVISHMQRILSADLGKPVILGAKGDVFDGMHRVAKAVLLEQGSIECVQFSVNPAPDMIISPEGKILHS